MRNRHFLSSTAFLATAFFVLLSGCYTQVATHDHSERVVERRTVYVTDEGSGEYVAVAEGDPQDYREGYRDGYDDASQYRRYFRRFYPATALYYDTQCGWDWTFCSSYTHFSFGWGSYWPTYYYSPAYWYSPWYASRPFRPYTYYTYGPFYGGYRYDAPGMIRGRDFEPRGNTIGRGGLNVAGSPGRSVGRTLPSNDVPRGDSRTIVTAPTGGEAGKTVPVGRVTGRPSATPVGRGEVGRSAPDARRDTGRDVGAAPTRGEYRTPPPSRRTETNAPASRPTPRTETRPAPRTETSPAPRTESRPAPRTEPAPASRPAPRTESAPAPRTDSTPAPRTESRPAPRTESAPAQRSSPPARTAPDRGSNSNTDRSAPRGRTSDSD